jgi:peptide-methionine (S)-S-oxide reductase
MEKATFGGGCFWCTEAIFKRLKGVSEVVSGYAGGLMDDPSYSVVSTGSTGHAESVQITFDPSIISYHILLEVFFATHNPTTPNQQGADMGTQYRSIIFYHSGEQQKQAEEEISTLEKEKKYDSPIVTEVVPFKSFYTAEEYHQNYYDANPTYPYCSVVIDPKIKKLLSQFGDKVKEEYR